MILLLVLCLFAAGSAQLQTMPPPFTGPDGGFPFSVNVFDIMGPLLSEGIFGNLTESDLGLDNMTSTGFSREVEAVFNMMRPDVCPDDPKKCSFSMIMGCTCRKAFKKLGKDCTSLPCDMFTYVSENAAGYMKRMLQAESIGEIVEVVLEGVAPLLKKVCSCSPGVYNAVETCLTKYDGMMLGDAAATKNFTDSMKGLEFKALKKALGVASSALCGSKEGECVEDFSDMMVELATMFDRSLGETAPGEQCLSFRRLNAVIMNVYGAIAGIKEDKKMSEAKRMNAWVKEVLKVKEDFWCGAPDCAEHLSEEFATCCVRSGIKKLDMKFMKNIIMFANSAASVITEMSGDDMSVDALMAADMMKGKTLKAILRAADPFDKMCPELYEDFMPECY